MASDNLQANWDLCHIHEKGESSSAAVLRARSASTTTLATLTSWRLAGDGGGLDWASARTS